MFIKVQDDKMNLKEVLFYHLFTTDYCIIDSEIPLKSP